MRKNLCVAACLLLAGCGASPGSASALPDTCPEPVILVHGTFHTGSEAWGKNYLPTLTNQGCDVSVIDLPNRGYGDIRESATQLSNHVANVLQRSGSRRVDLITHSQGGLVARWFIQKLGGVEQVDDLVMLAPPNRGTAVADLARGKLGYLSTSKPFNPGSEFGRMMNGFISELAPMEESLNNSLGDRACGFSPNPFICTAAMWQMGLGEDGNGSRLLSEGLNADDMTPAPVDYTVIYSHNDQVIVPNSSPPLAGPVERVANIAIQDLCAEPGRPLRHVAMLYDSATNAVVLDALQHEGPANPFRLARTNPNGNPDACENLVFAGADGRIDRDFDQFPRPRNDLPHYSNEPWPDCSECNLTATTR